MFIPSNLVKNFTWPALKAERSLPDLADEHNLAVVIVVDFHSFKMRLINFRDLGILLEPC